MTSFVRKLEKSFSYGKHTLFSVFTKSTNLDSTARFHLKLTIKILVSKVKTLPG